VVEEAEGAERLDDLGHPLLPLLVAELLAGGVADRIVVGLAFAEGVVGELEVGEQQPVLEERRAESGTEGEHQLEAFALDHGRALQVGVVGHLARGAEVRRQATLEVEVGPGLGQLGCRLPAGTFGGDEMGGRQHVTVADHAGEADRDPVEVRQGLHQIGENGDELLRRERVRRRDADPVVFHGPGDVEHRRLEAGTADVDGERVESVGGPGRLGGRRLRAVGRAVRDHATNVDGAPGRGRMRPPDSCHGLIGTPGTSPVATGVVA
jgi:hypothetical protein